MGEYLGRIAHARPGFEVIGMGRTVWESGIGGRFIRRTVSSVPDFWGADFEEPFRHSRFDAHFLPNFAIEIVDNSWYPDVAS